MKLMLRKGRRATTLPAFRQGRTTAAFAGALKTMVREMAEEMNRPSPLFAAFEPDPWDEAVKSIERRHALREEWPFPW